MQKRYKGLSNIGATCYMNSLLQTLYMTPEFRYGIYKWNYNQKIHPKQTDSIIFQLQKLFGKLQTDFPNEVSTKQLVKSFQWQDEQAQMQQDIQQFNRLLFEALQKSLGNKSEKYIHQNFVRDHFQGELVHYTKCYQCNNESAREQDFQDVIITVKNVYEKVYNDRLELGIQRYLKPEILDENNLYDCENCGKKTKAERGTRFIKMPSLFNVIFQRFTFNYFTMQREKINDRVQFPFILNFNDYIDGYDKIPNKLNEDSSQYFKNSHVNGINGKGSCSKFSGGGQIRVPMQKKSSTPSIAGKTKTKPSANTKSFLAEMRKKKKGHEDQNEDLVFVNGTTVASQPNIEYNSTLKQQTQSSQKKVKSNHSIMQNQANEQKIQQNGHKQPSNEQYNQNNEIKSPLLLPPPPPPLQLVPSDLSVPYKMVENSNNESIESQLQMKKLQSQKFSRQKQQQLLQLEVKNRQKIKIYLQQGPLVYQLYAVLVHNGTANHGHYYSYIKSFQDSKWYCFNDERVTSINVLEIEKTFGNGNSNAYALYYRIVVESGEMSPTHCSLDKLKVQLPGYIKQRINIEKNQIKQKEQTKYQNLQNLVTLKICYQLYVKQLQVYKSNSLDLIVSKARQIYNICPQIKKQNVRLRMFNPATETKLQTFDGRSHLSLEQLKIGSYKNLLLEIKTDNEQFEQYQVGSVSLRIALIQQNNNLNSLEESHLKLHKISIKKDQTIKSIIRTINEKRRSLSIQDRIDEKLNQNKQDVNKFIEENNKFKEKSSQFSEERMKYKGGDNEGLCRLIQKTKEIKQETKKSQELTKALKGKTKLFTVEINKLHRESKKCFKEQQLCLIKRHMNNDESIHEIISESQNLNKTIDDLNIMDNEILFVESKGQSLLWPVEFENQIYRISIKYNKPGTNEYISYLTDSRIKVGELKNQLCLFLEVNPEDIIFKWGTKSGRELKDLEMTLKDARFIAGTQVYLDFGIPAQPGEIRIQLFWATDASPQVFNRLHEFEYLTDVPISGSLKASEVKKKFIPVVKKLKGIQLNEQQFIIRQRVSEKIGKIYRQKPMKEQQLIEKREIAIQLIPDQNLDIKEFSIYFRIWDQLNWQLSNKIELVVNKNTTMQEISQLLSVDPENKTLNQPTAMSICRILSIHKFNIIDLTQMEWFHMNQDLSVIGEPMFVNADGLLYVVKNGNEEPRQLTKNQEKNFGGTVKPAIVRNKPRAYQPKEAKSMKIKVIQKEKQPEQQSQKLELQGEPENTPNNQQQKS